MKKLSSINGITSTSSSTPAASTNSKHSSKDDGFIKMLNEAVSAANQKVAMANQTKKESQNIAFQVITHTLL